MEQKIDSLIGDARRIVILGHVRPDGDCVGSCLGLKNYLLDQNPDLDIQVYLEEFPKEYMFLKGAEEICHDFFEEQTYDLCFVLDCGDRGRLGDAARYMDAAGRRICIDHHITNEGVCEINIVDPHSSSTAELLITGMETEKISLAAAECLYLGIVHDTGVFKHSNTTRRTMQLAGEMLAKGVSSSHIIDDTFYKKTFVQNRILGCALLKAELSLEGRMISCILTQEDMAEYGACGMDLDGIIDQLRVTEGVEMAVLMHENTDGSFKISMRSNDLVNVSSIAKEFGGGGHVKAAGASIPGDPEHFLEILKKKAAAQLG